MISSLHRDQILHGIIVRERGEEGKISYAYSRHVGSGSLLCAGSLAG